VSYAEAVQFLYGLRLFGANFGLDNPRRLAALVGNPQEKLRFIHVAGTNGKGSTCAMLEGIYRAAGLRVGLFTSPHLISFRERIQVNRALIPEAEVARLVGELRAANGEQETTLFEFATVMALKFFAEQKCDLVIWETGLGGRLDATNIVTPLASVITNIAFDHQQWLGDTLEKIAAEKAGIIKPGIPVVTTTTAPEALGVIEAIAQRQGSPCLRVDAGVDLPPIGLLGDHQRLNAALAVATVGVLQQQLPVSKENIRTGLANVNWPGRLQLIQRAGGQKILLDGAHNQAGAEVLRAALAKEFAGLRPVFIFGALADKQWLDICRTLGPLAEKVFTVPVASVRTAKAEELAAAFYSVNPEAKVTVDENLNQALKASENEMFIVITGSLYLVGEALELLGVLPADTGGRALNEWTKEISPGQVAPKGGL